MKNGKLQKLVLAALFLAVGLVLPFLTAQVKEIGDTLLPMHLPVMLCGLLCGPYYGLTVGLLLPLFRSLLFSMPPIYPQAVWMACELATYGLVIGLVYRSIKKSGLARVYISLGVSMLCGRVVWGVVKAILLGIGGSSFTVQAFIVGGFLDAIPGILLQLILIPLIMSLVLRIRHTDANR